MVEGHPDHMASLPWLQRAATGRIEGFVASHSLAELYAVLSSLPVRPRLAPATVLKLIETNVFPVLTVIELVKDDYHATAKILAGQQISGGATYDGLIAWAASKAGADFLLTLNANDFERLKPALPIVIRSPLV